MKWLFFAIAALANGESCIQVGKPEFGRIEVAAKDITGATLRDPRIELTEVGSRQIFDINKPVPYGWYTIRLIVPGFVMIQRDVHLYQPALIVRAEFSIRGECEGPESLRGTIKSAAGRELWVKVVPILGVGGAESPVAPNGDFLIAGLDFGNYLLTVMDGDNAIHTETVAANGRNSLTIQL